MADGPNRLKGVAITWGVGALAWASVGSWLDKVHLSTSEQLLTGIFITLCAAIWLLADIASNARYLFVLAVGESIKEKDKPDA